MVTSAVVTAEVELNDTRALMSLAGPGNAYLKTIREHLGIELGSRVNVLRLGGEPDKVALAKRFFVQMEELAAEGIKLESQDHIRALHALAQDDTLHLRDIYGDVVLLTARGRSIKARGLAQRSYVHAMHAHDLTFAIGPAGTGKTYLAMAVAVEALLAKKVRRIILTRPAVEAGERLGYLPGDLAEKVNPYLRPLYDALDIMMDADRVDGLLKRGQIEVAPLAFMRGRTLNDCFVILDEAQNSTDEQMRMFLTRLGYESRTVVTGDVTQVDLPVGARSGLKEAARLLGHVEGIAFCQFTEVDVVRHPLVQRIVVAYERRDALRAERQEATRRSPPADAGQARADDGSASAVVPSSDEPAKKE
ncbi:MAG: PhoH family protein [Deltaproteobacteria bacterium]|nr:PhoH family protein [Deltaproteobacteria bacterium]